MVSGGGDNTRYHKGKRVKLPVISGHRTTGYTDCPGKRVFHRLPGLRDSVTAAGLPKIYSPTVSPDHTTIGGPREPMIQAGASHKLVWSVSVVDHTGNQVASFSDRRGERLRLGWTDSSAHPLPTTPGTYEIEIRGETPKGDPARKAIISFKAQAP